MRIETVSKWDAEALPPKKPPAPIRPSAFPAWRTAYGARIGITTWMGWRVECPSTVRGSH